MKFRIAPLRSRHPAAQERLVDKVAAAAAVKPGTAFYEQINHLVPWTLHLVQIARSPKRRRLPNQLLSEKNISHRAAALIYDNGKIDLEAEDVALVLGSPGAKFDVPVKVAIFAYGEAPASSLDAEQNQQPEAAVMKKHEKLEQPRDLPDEAESKPWQPGYKDISFPELQDSVVPKWVKNVRSVRADKTAKTTQASQAAPGQTLQRQNHDRHHLHEGHPR